MDKKKRRLTFVVNPISGTTSKQEVTEWIHNRLDWDRYDAEVICTQHAGHAMEIAARCADEGKWAVVAVGGDGTVNEVARSLVHTDTALGILPCGSGNGLARHLHIPVDSPQAIDTINAGRLRTIDYGRINDHLFFCTCGVGFDAVVSMKFAQAGKRGLATYLETAVAEGVKYQSEDYVLEVDGGPERPCRAFLIACGNASQWGNNAYITPHAHIGDGLLDVTIVEPFLMIEAPALSLQLFTKTIDKNLRIKTFRCHNIRIRRKEAGVVHFDGDPMMMDRVIDVNIIESGLKVMVPPGWRKKRKT